MSHFPSLFKSVDGALTSWLVQVNRFNDVVIYSLDNEGSIKGMTAGKPDDAIMEPLKKIHPICKLDIVRNPDDPWRWGFRTEGKGTWEAVRKSLMSKSSSEKRHRNRFIFDRWSTELEPYLIGQYWGAEPDLALTAKAIELDKAQAKDEEENAQ